MIGSYSHSLRVVACDSCGAPVETELVGGCSTCAYCGAENRLPARDERADRAQAQVASSVTEVERHARLREQAATQASTLPRSLRDLVDDWGRLRLDSVDEATRRWLKARRLLGAPQPFSICERLFHLTLLIAALPESEGRRAFLEAAIELLPDEGHRHILRCEMARYAAANGDLIAADEWLSLCRPKPMELAMDDAYRLATSTVALLRGEYDRVLSLLDRDAPMGQRASVDGALLRIEALARRSGVEVALGEYQELREVTSNTEIAHAIRTVVPSNLAIGVHHEALRREVEIRVNELERRISDPSTREAVRSDDDNTISPLALLVLAAAFGPLSCWFFSFMGGGETGDWHPGPLSQQPAWIWISWLLAAVLWSAGTLRLAASAARRQVRTELRAQLEDARRELAVFTSEDRRT